MARRKSAGVRNRTGSIGIKNETALHAALKTHYAQMPLAMTEIKLEGYVIDVVTPDCLIEIQTSSLYAMKKKLAALLPNHHVCVVYPLVTKVAVSYVDESTGEITGTGRGRGKSDAYLFDQLVGLRDFLGHPHFTLEVVSVTVEELRIKDGKGSWRRKGVSIVDRKLTAILETRTFVSKTDYLELLPPLPAGAFTNTRLARECNMNDTYAGRVTYCLFYIGVLHKRKKTKGNGWEFCLGDFPKAVEAEAVTPVRKIRKQLVK